MSGLDLTHVGTIIEAHEASMGLHDGAVMPSSRRGRRSRDWWATSDAESHFLDLPDFRSAQDRAVYMVREMARAALANIDCATADDPLFEYQGEWVSLNELLALVGRDAVDEALNRL